MWYTAQSFTNVVQKMMNAANPVVSPLTGLVLEYPTRLSELRSEGFDNGHRHFSHLHWLYPGTFLPHSANTSTDIFRAAGKTLSAKISSGGGHTGWSKMWESCLWARLRNGHQVGNAIHEGLSKYFTPEGLMGLHPKLGPSDVQGCNTCFHELKNPPQGKRVNGMATKNLAVVSALPPTLDMHTVTWLISWYAVSVRCKYGIGGFRRGNVIAIT